MRTDTDPRWIFSYPLYVEAAIRAGVRPELNPGARDLAAVASARGVDVNDFFIRVSFKCDHG